MKWSRKIFPPELIPVAYNEIISLVNRESTLPSTRKIMKIPADE